MTARKMKRYFIITFLITMLLGLSTFGRTTAYAAPKDQKVYDNYGLFTDDEVSQLEDISREYGEEGLVDIAIITTDALDGKTRQQYLEDFYDEYGLGYNEACSDAVLILINMDPNDRGVEIQGYGEAEYYVNNDRTEHILDDIVPMLSDGAYYDAMVEYAKQVAYYMNQEEGVDSTAPVTGEQGSGNGYGESSYSGPSEYYGENEDSIFFNTLFQLGIALVIGAVVVLIMALQSGGKITVNNRTYMDEQHSGLVSRQDDYLRTVTTRVKKPTTNTGGGRSSGGGGISSGGSSHSGGGRGF
jgi:uncharacterized protein